MFGFGKNKNNKKVDGSHDKNKNKNKNGKKVRKKKTVNLLEVLESVPLLSGLSSDERLKLSKGLKEFFFQKGDYLMREGEDGDSFYIIVEGRVSVLTLKNGIEECVAVLEAGDYAGEQALLQNAKRNASLVAASDTGVKAFICSQKLFKNILANNTSIKFAKRDAKRKAFMTAINYDEIENKENQQNDEKNQQEIDENMIEWLLTCVEENLLFKQLTIKQRKNVLMRMKLITVKCGQFVINQGDEKEKAETFYVVESGEYDVLVDGVKVHNYSRGGTFGELALLHNAPRAASIVCQSSSSNETNKLWEISRKHFRYALTQQHRRKHKQGIAFLRTVDLFKPLLRQELTYLNDALEEIHYVNKKDYKIFCEGDQGDKFYIIKKGKIKWSKNKGLENGYLSETQFFGERALRTKDVRAATISIATNNETILLSMGGHEFEQLLGPVINIIDDKIAEYKRSTELIRNDKLEKENKNKNKKRIKNKNKNKNGNGNENNKICHLTQLKTIGVLGKGGFGLVTLVLDPTTSKSYALKAIKKYQVIELELQKHIISEKLVMDELSNKFLVNLHLTYKDKLRVYFLLDVCLGGELFTILRGRRYFNEPTARFYAASVCEGFSYMHSLDIIYRDLKPENLVLDSRGYLKIADFGFAKKITDKTYTLCGTPDYLCPEIVTGQGHGKGCDWWTLGILIYEMLASFPPFVADEPIETYRKIIRGRIRFPRYFSQEVRDLIRGLLHNKPTRRLGVLKGGANNIRKHIWYKNFDYTKLLNGQMPAPIINKVKSNTDFDDAKTYN